MSWRDQLQQASFRNVEFFVDDHSLEFGRRVQLHDYPFKDDAYPEDLGGKGEVYTFPAFVIGDDYMTQRDKLIEALNKQGPGTLVHRYLGQVRVQGGVQRLRETNKEGGMARFSLVFYKAGVNSNPTSSVDTKQRVSARADSALQVIEQQFTDQYTVSGLPGWVSEQAQSFLSDLESQFSSLGVVNTTVTDYVNLPAGLAGQVIGLVGGLSSMTQFRKLFSFGNDSATVPTTTPSRIQQAANQAAIINMVQQSAQVEAARASSTLDYDSAQDAIATRNELASALDAQMQTADDDTYLALQDLRSEMVQDLTERAAKLKQIRSYIPQATLPSLVIAHSLYQDANRAEDIVARNKIGHPGFVAGGQTLEVLDA
jgi:prophage DNA circulation protein